MASYDAPFPDPIEIEINEAFNRMTFFLNQRREAVLTAYRDLKARPLGRERMEKELIILQADTDNHLKMNLLNELREQMLADIDQKLAEVGEPQLSTRIVFHSDTILLEQLIAELGEVFEEVSNPPNYSGMRPAVASGKRGRAPGELYSPHAVAVDRNNRIFVAEGNASESPARISVFSDRGEFLSNFTHQDMREPCGLATHGDYLYVTDTELHTIFQFKMDSQLAFMTKQGTRGSLIGHFNYPRNLTVSTSGNVYVADCKNNRVQILNSSLHHIRNLTKQPIYLPHDIKLTADEVYVLCAGNPCVHVFSHAGEVIRSLISTGNQMQMTEPLYFCLDAAKNIIISDHSAHRIKIFTKDGDLKKTLGEEGHQPGMLRYPTGLALTKELCLVVVSRNKNFAFQIFSSQ